MQTQQADYFGAYRTMKMMRDTNGVLWSNFTAMAGGALSGTTPYGGRGCLSPDCARSSKQDCHTDGCRRRLHYWGRLELFWRCFRSRRLKQIHDEGSQVLENIANIRVPVIAAIEGRAYIHSDYALLANVIVAAEGSTFQDVGHFAVGVVPGDGNVTTWSYRAGAGRARRSCSTRSRCQLVPHMNGESWQKSCRTAGRSVGRGNWPRCT